MQVSRSGYYAWKTRLPSARQQANEKLTEQIRTVYANSEQTYGSPRITEELREQGSACNEKRVARLMHLAQLMAVTRKRFVITTDSKHGLPVAENVLDREFTCLTPNARWAADITYIATGEGWLYLAVILDLFSRKVVGVLPFGWTPGQWALPWNARWC